METGIDSIEAVRAKVYGNKIDSEIDLNKKILHFDGNKFNIVSETQRKIVAKKSDQRITIDRYDGILVLDDESSTSVENIKLSKPNKDNRLLLNF